MLRLITPAALLAASLIAANTQAGCPSGGATPMPIATYPAYPIPKFTKTYVKTYKAVSPVKTVYVTAPAAPIKPVKYAPVVPRVVTPVTVVDCCEPKHCYAWACPGESLDQICLREYGDASLWPHVVEYNKLDGALCVDVPVLLPNIFSDGRLAPSTAPAPPRPAASRTATLPPAAPPAAPLG